MAALSSFNAGRSLADDVGLLSSSRLPKKLNVKIQAGRKYEVNVQTFRTFLQRWIIGTASKISDEKTRVDTKGRRLKRVEYLAILNTKLRSWRWKLKVVR